MVENDLKNLRDIINQLEINNLFKDDIIKILDENIFLKNKNIKLLLENKTWNKLIKNYENEIEYLKLKNSELEEEKLGKSLSTYYESRKETEVIKKKCYNTEIKKQENLENEELNKEFLLNSLNDNYILKIKINKEFDFKKIYKKVIFKIIKFTFKNNIDINSIKLKIDNLLNFIDYTKFNKTIIILENLKKYKDYFFENQWNNDLNKEIKIINLIMEIMNYLIKKMNKNE